MKRVLSIMLFVVFTFSTSVYAGELYECIDHDGTPIITSSPQDGMKCVSKDSYREPSPEELAIEKERAIVEKDKAIVKTEETPKAREVRINKCISCCTNKQLVCYNLTADSRLCAAEIQNCVATCNSEGASPSSWSDCWSQSDK